MLPGEKLFERVVHHAAVDGKRVNQQVLFDNCGKVLNSAEFRQKRAQLIIFLLNSKSMPKIVINK